MTEPTGEALELALAVFRAPARRHALRDRPLPRDIGQLIQLATGSPGLLADTAQVTGEAGPDILEAVRFYLQQSLFVPEASAYRVLGLEPDASPEQVREHHRWLQHWLHPDRHTSDWEAVFASRVNWAWGELRNAQRRRAYDATLREQHAGDTATMEPELALRPGWNSAAPPTVRALSLRSGLLLGASLGSCVLLVALLALRAERDPSEAWEFPGTETRANTIAGDPPADQSNPVVDTDASAPLQRTAPDDIPSPMPILSALASTTAPDPERQPGVTGFPARAFPEANRMPDTAPPAALPQTGRMATAGTAMAPGDVARVAVASRIEQAMPVAVASDAARPQPQLPMTVTPRPARNPAQQVAVEPETLAVIQKRPPDRPASAPVVPIARVELARVRIDQVTAFLSDPRMSTPPIWNDLRAQLQGERLRTALQSGATETSGNTRRMELAEPQWRIAPERARVSGTYRMTTRGRTNRSGRLTVELRWRENMWLVAHMQSVPVQ